MKYAYYNENDKYCVAWLRELIAAKQIPDGIVDDRSIADVQPSDLEGFTQCHFFAGIGGWAYALELADWPYDRKVWTGSCPCQPFSVAGKGRGTADPRHLWPVWFNLIRQCKPATIFGEQVASKTALSWLDGVQDDLEAENYAFAPFSLAACAVGANHKRRRWYFVADTNCERLEGGGARNGRDSELKHYLKRRYGGTYPHPSFVRQMMGYPPEWDAFAPTAMPSSRKSRQNSSKPI